MRHGAGLLCIVILKLIFISSLFDAPRAPWAPWGVDAVRLSARPHLPRRAPRHSSCLCRPRGPGLRVVRKSFGATGSKRAPARTGGGDTPRQSGFHAVTFRGSSCARSIADRVSFFGVPLRGVLFAGAMMTGL